MTGSTPQHGAKRCFRPHWLHPQALTQRLLLLLLSATLGVWIISAVSIYFTVKHEAQEIFDQALAETAHAILSVYVGQLQQADPVQHIPEVAHGQHSNRIIFQIWRRDGQLLYHSLGTPTTPLLAISPMAEPASSDQRPEDSEDTDDQPDDMLDGPYNPIKINNTAYRGFTAWDHLGQFQVQIAERDDIRQQIFDETAAHLFNTALLFLPLLGLLIFVLVKISLSPLRQLTQRITSQAIDDLQPIPSDHAPLELRPMVSALNQLLHKITQSFERERRFTANAAHELRTPLAAIRLHAQVLQSARNPAEATEAALDIQQGVDRCTRLIEQLLILARLDPQQSNPANEQQRFDLAIPILSIAQQYHYVLKQNRIDLQLQTPTTEIWGSPDQIEILLRNLLDNAIRYAGTDKTIWMSCGLNQQQQPYLSVEDQGVGIPAEQRDKVFDRFYRLPDAASTGSGLGLSIVRQIAQQHHAQIDISQGRQRQGCCFQVVFKQA